MPAIDGLPDIPSNFDIEDFIDINEGNDATCLHGTGEGKLRFNCSHSHLSYDDPIVFPGQPGAAHLHNFYGNDLADANSTYETLRTTGTGSCEGGPLNRTGYWFPAMIKPASAGFPIPKVVKPSWITIYYFQESSDLDDYVSENPAYPHTTFGLQGFPNGMSMVFGWEHTHPIQDPPYPVWGREADPGGARQNTLRDLYALGGEDEAQPSGYYDNIFARIDSPSCWDGENLTVTGGRTHLAYQIQDGYSHAICPASHPYRVPRLTFIIAFSNQGPEDWKDWYTSVDRHTGHNLDGGHGFHADWWGAWDGTIQNIWETNHLALGTTSAELADVASSSGILCQDDWKLTHSVISTETVSFESIYLPEAARYADIPTPPNKKRMRLNLTAA